MPGAEKACEVMLAKNQGKFGQEPLAQFAPGPDVGYGMPGSLVESPPPPPSTPPPAHLTPWRMYKTATGLPYYHNHTTGVTQWECPPELSASPTYGSVPVVAQQARYSPY